ncbi:MAG: pseudaminic acid cytidylyltransferase [Synergistales bacterium]|nr:pseudaminic acid cytidylyltransferase [Synergistales bacterium]
MCIAVLPARGGSKRIPRKNIRSFAGRPMIAYSIEAAMKSEIFASVVVSTDDEEIARIAREFGAEAPFLREKNLADDLTPISAATADAVRRMDSEAGRFSYVCQLMANCPLRNAEDIRLSFQQFQASGADSQVSVSRFGWQIPWWAMRRSDTFVLEPLFPDETKARSQDLAPLFCPTGAIWWARVPAFLQYENFYMPGVTGWEIPWERAMDIDTEEDWQMAEFLYTFKLNRRLEGKR